MRVLQLTSVLALLGGDLTPVIADFGESRFIEKCVAATPPIFRPRNLILPSSLLTGGEYGRLSTWSSKRYHL